MEEIDSSAFTNDLRQKLDLDRKIIESQATTHEYTNKDEIWNGNILEIRPRYPNFTLSDIAVANIDQKSEEEFAIRANIEYAMHLQEMGQRVFQDKIVDKIEIFKIQNQNPITQALVLSGFLENQDILIEKTDKEGKILYQKVKAKKTPYFRYVEGEDIPVFEERHIKRTERHFLDLSGEVDRIHHYVMDRLGLTKSRGMRGAAAIHEEHLLRTNIGTPVPADIAADKEKGFNVG